MKSELLSLIQKKYPYILDFRQTDNLIEWRLKSIYSEREYWYPIWNAPEKVEKMVRAYLQTGGNVK